MGRSSATWRHWNCNLASGGGEIVGVRVGGKVSVFVGVKFGEAIALGDEEYIVDGASNGRVAVRGGISVIELGEMGNSVTSPPLPLHPPNMTANVKKIRFLSFFIKFISYLCNSY
jgi:hypothetical protein